MRRGQDCHHFVVVKFLNYQTVRPLHIYKTEIYASVFYPFAYAGVLALFEYKMNVRILSFELLYQIGQQVLTYAAEGAYSYRGVFQPKHLAALFCQSFFRAVYRSYIWHIALSV